MPDTVYGLSGEVLSRLMPMAAIVSPSGHIRLAGPTLTRLGGDTPLVGSRFLEIFAPLRPRNIATIADLVPLMGRRLTFQMRNHMATPLRGHVLPLDPGRASSASRAPGDGRVIGQALIVNLSFGIDAADAVRQHDLTHADFAPTDLTVELLYLNEAKAAVTKEMRALNRRLQEAHHLAAEQAQTDPLTGVGNRRAFDAALARAVARAQRGVPFALMHIDLDRFKAVNDTLGHGAGDHVIATVAAILKSETRAGDVVGRVGGDEFVILLTGERDPGRIENLATRIIGRVEEPIDCDNGVARISTSIGVCISPPEDADGEMMTAAADAALYQSKHDGRGRCTFAAAAQVPANGAPAGGG